MPELPHVTDIIAKAGLIDTHWFTNADLEIGSAVHKATQYLDEGDLNWASVDSAIIRRVARYQIFLDEVKPVIMTIEEHVTNPTLQYCGTLDRRVIIGGYEGVLDIKGPSQAPWQGVQLAMYAACLPGVLKRWSLHLSDYKYKLVEHTERSDWACAKACITIANWRREHNV